MSEPKTPVITVKELRDRSKFTPVRFCSRKKQRTDTDFTDYFSLFWVFPAYIRVNRRVPSRWPATQSASLAVFHAENPVPVPSSASCARLACVFAALRLFFVLLCLNTGVPEMIKKFLFSALFIFAQ